MIIGILYIVNNKLYCYYTTVVFNGVTTGFSRTTRWCSSSRFRLRVPSVFLDNATAVLIFGRLGVEVLERLTLAVVAEVVADVVWVAATVILP